MNSWTVTLLSWFPSIFLNRPSIWKRLLLGDDSHLHLGWQLKGLQVLAARVAGGVEVGQVVLGADRLHPRHRAAAVVGEVGVAAHVDVVVAGLLEGPRHVGGGTAKLQESI